MYLDIVVLVLLLLGIIAGIKNGIFIEIISIFAFVINLILTKNYAPEVLKFFQRKGTFLGNNYFITYVFTFISLYLIISIVISFIKKALLSQSRGLFDRVLGAIIGAIKASILIAILLLIYISIGEYFPKIKEYAKGSKTMIFMAEITPKFEQYIPDYFIEKINEIENRQIIEKNLDKIL